MCKDIPEETLFAGELFSEDGKRYFGLCVCGENPCSGENEKWTRHPDAFDWQLKMELRFNAIFPPVEAISVFDD